MRRKREILFLFPELMNVFIKEEMSPFRSHEILLFMIYLYRSSQTKGKKVSTFFFLPD